MKPVSSASQTGGAAARVLECFHCDALPGHRQRNSLEAAAKKQCSLSWHAVKAQLAKQAGGSKPQDDPYLLKVGSHTD
jgi:hypothetical protein